MIVRRVEALGALPRRPTTARTLLAGYRRAANILKAEEKKDGEGAFAGAYDPALLREPEEKALADALETAASATRAAHVAKEDFEGAMRALARPARARRRVLHRRHRQRRRLGAADQPPAPARRAARRGAHGRGFFARRRLARRYPSRRAQNASLCQISLVGTDHRMVKRRPARTAVMAGLVPDIHAVAQAANGECFRGGCAGLREGSANLEAHHGVDGRDKPGHDGECAALIGVPLAVQLDATSSSLTRFGVTPAPAPSHRRPRPSALPPIRRTGTSRSRCRRRRRIRP